MNKAELQARTKSFALRIIRLTDSLPPTRAADVLGRQLLRSATSVGANYRSACRARSTAEFLSKLGIVEEESDESTYWLELLADSALIKRNRLTSLIKESDELTAIFVASIRTARRRKSSTQAK
ncbi:MAG: four helix bundle protein [Planctomycetes bacterium]|nr:four helix bundle protein [Planctomycetota bacterium]